MTKLIEYSMKNMDMIIEMQRIQTNPNNRIYLLLKGNIFAFLNKFYLNQPVAVFYINKINIVNTYKLHYLSLKKDLSVI